MAAQAATPNSSPSPVAVELPDEIFCKILELLEPAELQRTRAVSKKWREFIETKFGIQTVISCDNWKWTRASRCVKATILHSFTFPFPRSTPFRYTLKVVKFLKILIGRTMVAILQKCPNIEALEFHDVILDIGEPLPSSLELHLPNVKTIIFQHQEPTRFDLDAQRAAEVLFQFFTSIKFNKLHEVKFWCPEEYLNRLPIDILFCNALGECRTHWLFELILANRKTVNKLHLGNRKREFRLDLHAVVNGIEVQKPIQIHTLVSNVTLPSSWEFILSTQHFIRRLILKENAFTRWESGIRKVLSHSKEVVQLIGCLGGGGRPGDSVDLTVLASCSQLQALELKFEGARLLAMNILPVSLKVLALNGPLNKYDFASIGRRLINLETLVVDNGEKLMAESTQMEVGALVTVDLAIFLKLMTLSKLKQLDLRNCTMSWEQIIRWCRVESFNLCEMECVVRRAREPPRGFVGLRANILQRKIPV